MSEGKTKMKDTDNTKHKDKKRKSRRRKDRGRHATRPVRKDKNPGKYKCAKLRQGSKSEKKEKQRGTTRAIQGMELPPTRTKENKAPNQTNIKTRRRIPTQ